MGQALLCGPLYRTVLYCVVPLLHCQQIRHKAQMLYTGLTAVIGNFTVDGPQEAAEMPVVWTWLPAKQGQFCSSRATRWSTAQHCSSIMTSINSEMQSHILLLYTDLVLHGSTSEKDTDLSDTQNHTSEENTILSWRWRQKFLPKHGFLAIELHGLA
jgi:hypothetical protein